jgi:hypothetical protein
MPKWTASGGNGLRVDDERFVREYVAIQKGDGMHTYRVARVESPEAPMKGGRK